MISKQPGAGGGVVVTFRLAPEITGDCAFVVGEFNDWSPTANPMVRDDTSFVTTITVPAGSTYRFRYLVDGVRWENDWAADTYAPNEFGGDDSVLDVTMFPAASADDRHDTTYVASPRDHPLPGWPAPTARRDPPRGEPAEAAGGSLSP